MNEQATTVLVVEDDRANRTALVRLLQYDGALVESAATVAAALEKLKAHPMIVLLDINLPDGSGEALLRHINSQRMPCRVCVLSGSADPETLDRLRELRPDGIFIKPFHTTDVLEWVRKARR